MSLIGRPRKGFNVIAYNAQKREAHSMIAKGTTVRVCTTNGGVLVAPLLENHRRTYDVVVDVNGHCVIIPSFRVTAVEAVR